MTEQRIEQAMKLNAGLKKYAGTLEKISAISCNAQTELQKNSSKAYGVFGESNTIFQNIQSTVEFAMNAIKNDMYVFGVMLTPLEETISELPTIAYYRKPKSSIQLRRDPDKSYEYHYAINRWVEQHYPNLIGNPTSYEYQQMFNREGAKHNLTGDEFKVKIYLDYVEWKEQQLIDMRNKEDLYSAKINEVPKQETLLERFKNKLGLTK
ncbi:hypothetical protein [Streptococcus pluranimalium]|uniref:hypothetical protein n=1 Tax=Streptococcus pluranimalium TaxID=82348 RepID=UPI003F68D137